MARSGPARSRRPPPGDERRPAAAPQAPEHELLRLQRLTGNAAVTRLIARTPLQRDEQRDDERTAAKVTMKASDKRIGSIELLSVSFGTQDPGTAGRTGDKRERPHPGEVHCVKNHDKSTAILARIATSGEPIGSIEIVFDRGGAPYLTLKLSNVVVTSFASNEGQDMFSLSAASVEHESHAQRDD